MARRRAEWKNIEMQPGLAHWRKIIIKKIGWDGRMYHFFRLVVKFIQNTETETKMAKIRIRFNSLNKYNTFTLFYSDWWHDVICIKMKNKTMTNHSPSCNESSFITQNLREPQISSVWNFMLTLNFDDDDYPMAFENLLMMSLSISNAHEPHISSRCVSKRIFHVRTWRLTPCHICCVKHSAPFSVGWCSGTWEGRIFSGLASVLSTFAASNGIIGRPLLVCVCHWVCYGWRKIPILAI